MKGKQLLLSLMLLLTLTACSKNMDQSSRSKGGQTGDLSVNVTYEDVRLSSLSPTNFPELITSADIHLSKASTTISQALTSQQGQYTTTITDLGVGEWGVTVNMYNQNSQVVLFGTVNVTVVANDVTDLSITLGQAQQGNGDLDVGVHLPILSMAGGDHHMLVVKSDGTLWGTGSNAEDQLGIAAISQATDWTVITTNVVQVAAGEDASFMLKSDGSLWGTGVNYYGMMGLGHTTDLTEWTHLMDNVVKVRTSGWTVFVVLDDGSVKVAGYNYGMFGVGTTTHSSSWLSAGMSNINDVQVSNHATLMLRDDNTLWVAGRNNHGQIGMGSPNSIEYWTYVTGNVETIVAGDHHNFFIKDNGDLYGAGEGSEEYNVPLGVGAYEDTMTWTHLLSNIAHVTAGDGHSLAVNESGTVYTAGRNVNGQLGLATYANQLSWVTTATSYSNVANVFAENLQSFIILDDYSVLATGYNWDGQLGTTPLVNLPVWTDTF